MGKGFCSEKQAVSTKERKVYLNFLDKVLQITAQEVLSRKELHLLLEANLEKLNDDFARVLQIWATSALPTVALSKAERIAKAIFWFSYSIRDFHLGSKASNTEIAIVGYQSALQTYTRSAYQENWASLQYNLGLSYYHRIRGDRADNLEQATKHFQNSLSDSTCQTGSRDRWHSGRTPSLNG